MVRIALCDDEETELKLTYNMIKNWLSDSKISGQIYTFNSGNDLINEIDDNKNYDLYILDVLMPGENGIELGKKLRDHENDDIEAPIIYLTSTSGFAVESYEVHAFYYMLKPVTQEKFSSVLNAALNRLESSNSNVFPVRTKQGTVPLHYSDICFVELNERSLHFMCRNNAIDSVSIRGSFKEAVSQLTDDHCFFLCGASLLVNLEHIKSIEKNVAIFSTGYRTTIPRTVRKELYTAWLDYWLDGGK